MAASLEDIKQMLIDSKKYTDFLREELIINNQIGQVEAERARQQETNLENQRLINELKKNFAVLGDDEKKLLISLKKDLADQLEAEKKINVQRKIGHDLLAQIGQDLKTGWKYLQEQDKVIKSTILNLGMSGTKADMMRVSFEKSASFATMLGGTLKDISLIQEGFADETGRARALSEEMVKDILLIGKGTGIGIEQATKLAAQYEFMGIDARRTSEFVQNIVDISEKLGVSPTRVLKGINDNFKKLNTYSFKAGSKGIGEMAMSAEKFKVDMKDALSAADAAKGLEKAINLAANLQVMGGEFAKTDPFEWMYLARNEPDKLNAKISEMTRGIVTFRKMSNGTFEKFISPADRQRLESVANSLGISVEAMTEIAQRRAGLDKMNKELAGSGLTGREKELVEGAATFDSKSGKFQVKLAGQMRDISTLTKEQAESFVKEQVTLEERAKLALTFEDAFKAMVETLKATLLPLLRGVNAMLTPILNLTKWFSKLSDNGWGGIAVAAVTLLAGAVAWRAVGKMLNFSADKLVRSVGMGGGVSNAAGAGGGIAAGQVGSAYTAKGAIRKGAPELARGQGMRSLGKGAGIGAAAVGIGAGLGVAAIGVSKLADAMAKLDATQLTALPFTILALGGAMAIATIPLISLGAAAEVTAPGLAALGLVAVGVGVGIGAAAWGIGKMSEGLSTLVNSSKGAGWGLAQVAVGIGALNLAMATTGTIGFLGGMLGGFASLSKTLTIIGSHADNLTKVGEAFKYINAVMSGNKEDFIAVQNAVESISRVNTKGGGMLADLANILKNPLKVEFANNKVDMYSNITLEIDGQKFMQKTLKANTIIQKQVDARNGKSS